MVIITIIKKASAETTAAANYQSAHKPVPLFPEGLWRASFSISPPWAFMWGSFSEHAFLQGFPRIQPRGEKQRRWTPKTEKDPPLVCFQVTPSHIPSTNAGRKLGGSHSGMFLTSINGWFVTGRYLCLSLCFRSHTCTKLLNQVGKFMEKYGKIKGWVGGCGWYALMYSHNFLLLGGWAALVVSQLSLTQSWLQMHVYFQGQKQTNSSRHVLKNKHWEAFKVNGGLNDTFIYLNSECHSLAEYKKCC